ncbi:MAG: PH domain-containing protein [Nocardioidaceae bacterium]
MPDPAAGVPDVASVEHPFRRLSPLTPLVRSSILVVAVLASTWDRLLHGELGPIAALLLALLLAGAAWGAASWLRTKYWIEADELRVDTGVVSRQSRRIRVDRLQGIDIVQPFVARLFGLAELKMDVAGGGSKEGSLAFLRLEDAQQLRTTLLSRRDAVLAGRGTLTPPDPADRADQDGAALHPAAPAPEHLVARLDLGILLVSLLLSPETIGFLATAVVIGGVFAVLGPIGGAVGVVPVVLGFGLTQFRKLSAFYGFTVTVTATSAGPASAVQVRRGLFELSAQTITLARVQGVVVTEPLLWRRLGWARLDVSVAGQGARDADGKPSGSTVMPVAPRDVVLSLARTLLADAGGPDPDAVVLTPPPTRARWVAPLWRRFLAAGVGEHLVVSREGMLSRRTHVVPHARVQSLQIHQGPVQRMLGLADLHVDSPPGSVKVRARHRDAGEARRLLDTENALTAASRRPAAQVLGPAGRPLS